MVRRLLAVLLSGACAAALAQQPPRLEPLPPPPPAPPGLMDAPADEPRVRIAPPAGEDRVEEIRQNGRVVMLKVTPPGGIPYYLVDTTGNGNWVRRDSLDDGVRVPMWTIWSFD
ncbi:MAG: DUF2782 domain-containing protein [Burkholderiales bacterium]|nr:DUF2782 domain-containing protein [Burkholderiales bacterium]